MPHRTSTPIEGTQSPALSASRPGRSSRGDRRDVARVWLTAPRRPIRCRFSRDRTTWLGVPSFFSPTRLADGFGPKELCPTLHWSDSPLDLAVRSGSPAPRRHPGARRHGYAVVTLVVYARYRRLSSFPSIRLFGELTDEQFKPLRALPRFAPRAPPCSSRAVWTSISVQRLLGHASAEMTLNVYAHYVPSCGRGHRRRDGGCARLEPLPPKLAYNRVRGSSHVGRSQKLELPEGGAS